MQLKHLYIVLMVICYLHDSKSAFESALYHNTTTIHAVDHTYASPLAIVETFCKFLNISSSNCSCEISSIVCDFTHFLHHNNTDLKIFQRWHGVTMVYATIAVISSTLGMIGNSAVIFIAYQQRTQISPCKLHIAELAVVNFIFSGVQVVNTVPLYWTNIWIYGQPICKLSKSLLEMGSLMSSLFFQLIAVERYVLIMYAVQINKIRYFEDQYKHHFTAGIILVVLVTMIPYIDGLCIESDSQRCVTFSSGSMWSLPYNWFTFLIYSCLPIFVTSTLTAKLIIHFSQEADTSLLGRDKVNKRIMLHLLLVLSLFIICTLPSRLVSIILNMVDFRSHNALIGFQFLSYTLYSVQGTLNPILYSMMAKEWRKELLMMSRSVFGQKTTLLVLESSFTSHRTRMSIPSDL